MDWSTFFHNISSDVRFALRGFRKSPTFVAAAVLTVALGVGVNAALFSLMYSLVLRPLPVPDPTRVHNVHVETRGEGSRHNFGMRYYVSWAEYQYMRSKSKTADVAGLAPTRMSWKDHTQGALFAEMTSDNLLPILGGKPVLGRFFTYEEAHRPEHGAVVVLSYPFWQKHFGGAMDVVGKGMTLNRKPFTIVGVASETTTGPMLTRADIWVPLSMQGLMRSEGFLDKPNVGWIQLMARRRDGFSGQELQAEMSVLAQQALRPHLPDRVAMVSTPLGAFFNYPFVSKLGTPIFAVLFVAVSLVLLVACANVANMLLARGLSRRREIAVRLSIGAGRGRLIQQLLTESILLSVAGGVLGLVLAQAAAQGIVSMLPVQELGNIQLDLGADRNVILYTLAVSVATAFLFGLMPAWRAVKLDLSPALKTDGLQFATRPGRFRLQSSLIVVQVSICLALLVSAGLLMRSLHQAFTVDIGRATRNVLIASFDFEQNQYTPVRAAQVLLPLRDNLRTAPQVVDATFTDLPPFTSYCNSRGTVLGTDGQHGLSLMYACESIGPDYFRTMKIAPLQGRVITAADMAAAARVTVIDAEFARRLAQSGPVLGRKILLDGGQTHEVVGVVARAQDYSMGAKGDPKAYTPISGDRLIRAQIAVQYEGASGPVIEQIRRQVGALDSSLAVSIDPIERNVATALTPMRMGAAAASGLGALALLLACTGVYAVVAFAVSRRRREIGIRVALGADRRDVLKLVVWQGFKPVLIGAAVGLAMAAAAAHVLKAMLFGLGPLDPISFGGMTAALMLVALAAALIPARMAVRVEPAVALRQD